MIYSFVQLAEKSATNLVCIAAILCAAGAVLAIAVIGFFKDFLRIFTSPKDHD